MQQKTSPAATRGGSTRREDGTRRLLNLLFALSVASEPLTTDRIINDPEIGYSGRERESRVKAFNRDRDTLAGLGVYIREAAAYRDAKNEQRRWEIDRRSTHADGTALSPYDAQEAIAAIDQLFSLHAADPARWPLQMARAKLCKIAGIDPEATHVEQGHAAADLAHVWSAFVRRRPATFVYRDARGEERTHIVDLYGMFERGTPVSYTHLDIKDPHDDVAGVPDGGEGTASAILHMHVTDAYTAETELDNTAQVDLFRNGGGERCV